MCLIMMNCDNVDCKGDSVSGRCNYLPTFLDDPSGDRFVVVGVHEAVAEKVCFLRGGGLEVRIVENWGSEGYCSA